jgi:hypothetical protein
VVVGEEGDGKRRRGERGHQVLAAAGHGLGEYGGGRVRYPQERPSERLGVVLQLLDKLFMRLMDLVTAKFCILL